MKYKVAEIFQSINGEGMKAGELAVFVRFQGCNLSCRYCDTKWANEAKAPYKEMDEEEIVSEVKKYALKNVTITGGEPLLQKNIESLLLRLAAEGMAVEIETNGSVDLQKFAVLSKEISFTMDYKLPDSGMEEKMNIGNFSLLTRKDTVKFVVSGRRDLECALRVYNEFLVEKPCSILLSPVFGKIHPEEIVAFMKEKRWTGARLQLQLHKIIWDADKRGV
jgi:7-carboxy-7-deazaguanine synthase